MLDNPYIKLSKLNCSVLISSCMEFQNCLNCYCVVTVGGRWVVIGDPSLWSGNECRTWLSMERPVCLWSSWCEVHTSWWPMLHFASTLRTILRNRFFRHLAECFPCSEWMLWRGIRTCHAWQGQHRLSIVAHRTRSLQNEKLMLK